MVKALLVRGMIAGVVAGLLAFGFARFFGEPEIDKAIAFEELIAKADHVTHDHNNAAAPGKPELVSRSLQASFGLFTAVAVYGAGIGGLFSIVFALAYGRMGEIGARATAALLAAAGFVSVVIVPFLKYPANPPAVGSHETLGSRTALFLIMIAISIAALGLAVGLGRRLSARFGFWNASLIAGATFVVIIAVVQLALPDVNEVPEQFPADVLWRFRIAALGMHAVMWTVLGLLFGALTEPALARRGYKLGRRPA